MPEDVDKSTQKHQSNQNFNEAGIRSAEKDTTAA